MTEQGTEADLTPGPREVTVQGPEMYARPVLQLKEGVV